MNWHEYPILRLLVPLILGILFYFRFPEWSPHWIITIPALLVLAFLSWPRQYLFPYKHRYISGFLVYLVIFVLGNAIGRFHFPYNQENYFARYLQHAEIIEAQIVDVPEVRDKNVRLVAEACYISDSAEIIKTSGRLIIYLQKDSNALQLHYGDKLTFRNKLQKTAGPKNPDEFDYAQYLYRKGIAYRAFLRAGEWNARSGSGLPVFALVHHIRNYLLHQLQKNGLSDAEYSVAAAMILGTRGQLSPELRKAFSGAGAMHILCVSGLHVGIIYLLLSNLFSFLGKTRKTRLIKTIILLSGIWLYAMITGLSPSVVRAATMFSFISIGQNIGRHVNIYNSLAASAFVLLIFNPYLIFDVGFQLSYSAVVAIVALQKPLQDLWSPANLILFKAWQLITVSLAAQIGTAPLAMYYFHSFPNYFLLTNLIVIPAAFVIFITGVALLLFSWAGPLANFLGWLLSKMILLLNLSITFIEQLPFAVSQRIYLSPGELTILIILIVLLSLMFIRKSLRPLPIALMLGIAFLILDIRLHQADSELIAYQDHNYDYIAWIHQGTETALTDPDVVQHPDLMTYHTEQHSIRMLVDSCRLLSLDATGIYEDDEVYFRAPFLALSNTRIALLTPNSFKMHFNGTINVDYIVLSQNPQVKIADILRHFRCRGFVFGNTNAPWMRARWKQELKHMDIPYWDIQDSGAFVLNTTQFTENKKRIPN